MLLIACMYSCPYALQSLASLHLRILPVRCKSKQVPSGAVPVAVGNPRGLTVCRTVRTRLSVIFLSLLMLMIKPISDTTISIIMSATRCLSESRRLDVSRACAVSPDTAPARQSYSCIALTAVAVRYVRVATAVTELLTAAVHRCDAPLTVSLGSGTQHQQSAAAYSLSVDCTLTHPA